MYMYWCVDGYLTTYTSRLYIELLSYYPFLDKHLLITHVIQYMHRPCYVSL